LEQVKWAILENDGTIAIVPVKEQSLNSNDTSKKLT
jgi:uncharacterized membrane protein YcaP (DUF421 family)